MHRSKLVAQPHLAPVELPPICRAGNLAGPRARGFWKLFARGGGVALTLPSTTAVDNTHHATTTRRLMASLEALGATCPACEGVRRKFPRSSHLANLGAATHDDLLLDAAARALFVGKAAGVVTLEEKMDGGNIGISLSGDGRHVFQKRAHFVSSASETQYKQLEIW